MTAFMPRFTSDIVSCPIGFVELWDHPMGVSASSSTSVTATTVYTDLSLSYFSVDLNSPFKSDFTLRAQSLSMHTYLNLKVSFEICQTQAQLNSSIPTMSITHKQDSGNLTLLSSEYAGNFTIQYGDCPIDAYALYNSVDPSLVVSTDTQISIDPATFLITIDKSLVLSGRQYLRGTGIDSVGTSVEINYQICSENSIKVVDNSTL